MKKTTKTPAKPAKAKKPAPKATKPKAKAKPAAAKKPPVVVKTGGNAVVVPSVAKVTQNGVSRPRATFGDGTPKKTARVWQIADELSAKNAATAKASKTEAQPPTRQEMLAACAKEKITPAVCWNQFYRWRKFNGLFGRIKLDGTVAAVTGGPKRGAQAETPKAKPSAKKPAAKVKAPAKPKATKPAAPKPAKPAVKPPVVATGSAQAVLPFVVPAAVAPAPAAGVV